MDSNSFAFGGSDGVFLSTVVLVEVSWVLRGAYKLDRATIARELRRLIGIAGVVVEHQAVVRRALDLFEREAGDFSDYVIVEASRDANALPVITFDVRLARHADVRLLGAQEVPSGQP